MSWVLKVKVLKVRLRNVSWWVLQVNAPLDFLLELPNLRSVMIGKQSGTWSPCSMLYMTDFMMKLMAQHPTKNILRISCPGHNATPFDEEDAAA